MRTVVATDIFEDIWKEPLRSCLTGAVGHRETLEQVGGATTPREEVGQVGGAAGRGGRCARVRAPPTVARISRRRTRARPGSGLCGGYNRFAVLLGFR